MAFQDLHHALRIHFRHPFLTSAIVLTLAVGIGATTAIFSLVNAVLLRPLAYPESGRLVVVRQTYENLRTSPNPRLQAIWNRIPVSYLNTLDWREQSRTLANIGLYREFSATLESGGEPRAVEAAEVDAELFEVLGVSPALGRTFGRAAIEGEENVVILGHGLWQSLWGGAPEILGETLRIDGEPHMIVAVMPAGFDLAGGRQDRLWTPLRLTEQDLGERNNQRLSALARLVPGTTLEVAQKELDQIAAAQAQAWPETNESTGAQLTPLLDSVVGESRALLFVLLAAAGVVLAVASVNVVHLLLVQVERRSGEMGIRRALGASRGRLMRQLLVENLLPALLGGGLGLILALLGRDLLPVWIPDLPRAGEVPIDARVLVFALVSSLTTAAICALPAALSSSTRGVARAARGSAGRGGRLADGLVIAEVALTLMLAVAAGLLVNSALRLAAVEPGFRTAGLLVQDVVLPTWSYPDEERRQAFAAELVTRLGALSGARGAALTSKLPFGGPALVAGFEVPGAEVEAEDWTQGHSASLKFVTPGYFETLEIALRRGRVFTAADRPESGRVAVINETLATRIWPAEDPTGQALGRSIVFADESYAIVGVVEDVRHDGVAEDPGVLMYFPWSQRGAIPALAGEITGVIDVGETFADDPLDLAPQARAEIREIDPALAVPAATTMESLLAGSLGAPRARASLVLVLSGLALFLALVGTYAMMSYSVSRRRLEIGVRMALGATAGQVGALVLRRAFVLAGLGIGLGIAGALLGGRWLEALLWGIEASDPPTLTTAALALALATVLAGLLPALRASRVDPARVLREE